MVVLFLREKLTESGPGEADTLSFGTYVREGKQLHKQNHTRFFAGKLSEARKHEERRKRWKID